MDIIYRETAISLKILHKGIHKRFSHATAKQKVDYLVDSVEVLAFHGDLEAGGVVVVPVGADCARHFPSLEYGRTRLDIETICRHSSYFLRSQSQTSFGCTLPDRQYNVRFSCRTSECDFPTMWISQ